MVQRSPAWGSQHYVAQRGLSGPRSARHRDPRSTPEVQMGLSISRHIVSLWTYRAHWMGYVGCHASDSVVAWGERQTSAGRGACLRSTFSKPPGALTTGMGLSV